MAQASSTRQRIEWRWKSDPNPCSSSEPAEWHSYSDVETLIIEEAFIKKFPEVLLDDYHIDFEHFVQISNSNVNNRRPIKRIINEREDTRLREERFFVSPISLSTPFTHAFHWEFIVATKRHFNVPIYFPSDYASQMLAEKAAEGLIIEGKNVGKQKEAEWMAHQLLKIREGTPQELRNCCARLYCMESFLYKKLNECMRLVGDDQHEELWKSKVPTFGPFAWLLYEMDKRNDKGEITVYRGANLSNDLIEHYKQKSIDATEQNTRCEQMRFPVFTSTSRNRVKAEQFGNVLFIIDIHGWMDGRDVSCWSEYNEEEYLLNPDFKFFVRSCKFDEIKGKWIIHIRSIKECTIFLKRSPASLPENKIFVAPTTMKPPAMMSLDESDTHHHKKLEKNMNKEIFFHGGTLLTSEQQQKLNEFYGESRAQWQLIYKATKDGFDAKDFHRQCDGKGPTMTIIQSTRGYIFGGYTAVPWSSNFGSRLDSTAFLFTLENPHDIPMTMFNIDTRKSKYAVIHHGYCGPIFGVNNNIDACDYELNYDPRYADLCVWGGSNSMDSYTNFPNFFIDTVGCANKTFTGNNRFRCMDIELYVLTDN